MASPAQPEDVSALVLSGNASGDQLEAHFALTPDQSNRLAAQWQGPAESQRLFRDWYAHVIEPIGLDRDAAFSLFVGELPIEQYAASLTSEQANRFVEMFPGLQAEHQVKLDARR